MSKLFETTAIKGTTLTNRFIRSATWEGMAHDDGSCTPRLIKTMVRLAQGGVGLIITGHAYVRRDGQAGRHPQGNVSIRQPVLQTNETRKRALLCCGGKAARLGAHRIP